MSGIQCRLAGKGAAVGNAARPMAPFSAVSQRKPAGGAEAVVLDVDGYISRTSRFFEQNGFFERELTRKTEVFGNVAHAFSTYASYSTAQDSAPFSRGVNSIQMLKDGQRWWVVSIFWDAERPGLTLPPQYLPPSRP